MRYDRIKLSILQEMILEHCCINKVVEYNSLIKETGKARTTLIQSVNSLLKHGYIKKQKVKPGNEKSKLIFKLTHRGRCYTWNSIGLDAEDVLNDVEYPEINNYIQLVKKLPKLPRKYMLHNIALKFLVYESMEDVDKKILMKDSFRNAIFESIQDQDFEVSELYDNKLKEWIRQMYSKDEIKEFKEEFSKIKDNLKLFIEKFPD